MSDSSTASTFIDNGDSSDSANASTMTVTWRMVLINLSLFLLAGLLEIGGGWLYWRFFRLEAAWWNLLLGALALLLYGWIPTLQPIGMEFSRTFAVYGGIFIIMSVAWGWSVDGNKPDKGDLIGSGIACAGVLVMLYYPRD